MACYKVCTHRIDTTHSVEVTWNETKYTITIPLPEYTQLVYNQPKDYRYYAYTILYIQPVLNKDLGAIRFANIPTFQNLRQNK